MSSAMVGSRGEIMILMVKFRKKIEVRKNRGRSCNWNFFGSW
jgi:hypothetical protein